MVAVALGVSPIPLTVYLATGGGFLATLVASVSWPEDITITMTFSTSADAIPSQSWVASVSGTTAQWNVPPATVAEVISVNATWVSVIYETDDSTLVWMKGRVEIV